MTIEASFTFGPSPTVNLSFPSEDGTPKLREQPNTQESSPPQQFQPPIAKSFSFTIPEAWGPTKGSVLRWLSEVPLPEERHEPPPSTPVYRDFTPPMGEKHRMDHDMSSQAPDEDHHRSKRAKLRESWGQHSALEQNRVETEKSRRSLLWRISNAYMRVLKPSPRGSDVLDGATMIGSASPSIADRTRMRFVFVGDSKCGKSSLLLRYYRETFDPSYNPTQYELFTKTVAVNGKKIELKMWDTSGDIKLHQLQQLSYISWDAVFLCFNLTSQKGFQDAQTKWLSEIRTHCKGDVPIILTGLKKDERSSSSIWTPFYRGGRISAGEGSMAANGIGAVKYVECSAKTGEGINGIIEAGVLAVIDERAAVAEAARIEREKDFEIAEKALAKRLSSALCFG